MGVLAKPAVFEINTTNFKDNGYNVAGLSTDSPDKQKKFKARQNLPFDLLSDSKKVPFFNHFFNF